jgi:hypothetical protein
MTPIKTLNVGMVLRLRVPEILGGTNRYEIGTITAVDPGSAPASDDVMWVPQIVSVLVDGQLASYTAEYIRRTAEIFEDHDL